MMDSRETSSVLVDATKSTLVFFPGAGGEVPNLAGSEVGDANGKFETVHYPGWRRYAMSEFTAETLMADLEAQIAAKAPHGPLQIVGYSIGAHFGYVMALRLRALGRVITRFCVLDSFMIGSVAPSPGWRARALAQGLTIIRARRVRDFILFVRSKFWRALLRLSPERLPNVLLSASSTGLVARIVVCDRVLENELTIHLLVRKLTPWIQALDQDPEILSVPTVLLRTRENSKYDEAWLRRCSQIEIVEISGQHQSLFGPENIIAVRAAFAAAMRKLT
jgi:thioesterase domain-containing protein